MAALIDVNAKPKWNLTSANFELGVGEPDAEDAVAADDNVKKDARASAVEEKLTGMAALIDVNAKLKWNLTSANFELGVGEPDAEDTSS